MRSAFGTFVSGIGVCAACYILTAATWIEVLLLFLAASLGWCFFSSRARNSAKKHPAFNSASRSEETFDTAAPEPSSAPAPEPSIEAPRADEFIAVSIGSIDVDEATPIRTTVATRVRRQRRSQAITAQRQSQRITAQRQQADVSDIHADQSDDEKVVSMVARAAICKFPMDKLAAIRMPVAEAGR